MPQRTLAMVSFDEVSRSSRLFVLIGVVALHALLVEDVVYFALLGYPPVVSVPPLAYAYLPASPGLRWTPPTVWAAATLGLTVYATSGLAAVRSARRPAAVGG